MEWQRQGMPMKSLFRGGRGLRCGFIGFARNTFDARLAGQYLNDTLSFLHTQCEGLQAMTELVTNPLQAVEAAESLRGVDVLIAQFTTFVDSRFIEETASRLGVPVILWALRELNSGSRQRLALNSLTGANLAAHKLTQLGLPFQFIYGNPGESALCTRLQAALRLFMVYLRLRSFTVVSIGRAPDGFHFSEPSCASTEKFGLRIHHIDLDDVFRRCLAIRDADVEPDIQSLRRHVRGLTRLDSESVYKFAKLQRVLREEIRTLAANAVVVRCWPEFFTSFGAAACSTLSALTDDGIMAACEADVLGALSMDVLACLTESPAYLGDLVELDESSGAMTFWHCGAGAFSLARQDTGAQAGHHPNRGLGFTLEFGLKPGRITLFRMGEAKGGAVRALIGEGEVLDKPQRFLGTSAQVVLSGDGDPLTRLTRVIEAGFEPHYALAYGSAADELERLCRFLDVPVRRF
jgi:L-fucose isomerase-like protein